MGNHWPLKVYKEGFPDQGLPPKGKRSVINGKDGVILPSHVKNKDGLIPDGVARVFDFVQIEAEKKTTLKDSKDAIRAGEVDSTWELAKEALQHSTKTDNKNIVTISNSTPICTDSLVGGLLSSELQFADSDSDGSHEKEPKKAKTEVVKILKPDKLKPKLPAAAGPPSLAKDSAGPGPNPMQRVLVAKKLILDCNSILCHLNSAVLLNKLKRKIIDQLVEKLSTSVLQEEAVGVVAPDAEILTALRDKQDLFGVVQAFVHALDPQTDVESTAPHLVLQIAALKERNVEVAEAHCHGMALNRFVSSCISDAVYVASLLCGEAGDLPWSAPLMKLLEDSDTQATYIVKIMLSKDVSKEFLKCFAKSLLLDSVRDDALTTCLEYMQDICDPAVPTTAELEKAISFFTTSKGGVYMKKFSSTDCGASLLSDAGTVLAARVANESAYAQLGCLRAPADLAVTEFVGGFWNLDTAMPRSKEWLAFQKRLASVEANVSVSENPSESCDRLLAKFHAVKSAAFDTAVSAMEIQVSLGGSWFGFFLFECAPFVLWITRQQLRARIHHGGFASGSVHVAWLDGPTNARLSAYKRF